MQQTTEPATVPVAASNLESMLADVEQENAVSTVVLSKEDAMTGGIDLMVKSITNLNSDHSPEAVNFAASMEKFGLDAQKNSGKRSQMLKQSIGKLKPEDDKDPDNVGNMLMNLNSQMVELDPTGVSMDKPWWSNLQFVFPFLKTPLQRYFMKYQSADSVLDNIRSGLLAGQKQLENDSKMLEQDQRKMRASLGTLNEAIAAGTYLRDELDYAVTNDIQDDTVITFVKDQMLFPLSQRLTDLQQQAAVNQQGIMSSALIIRTNKDLIAGVNRALTVSMAAMEIAVALSLALANQKLVLKQLNAMNETTGNMIAGVGKMLKQNAAEIQQQASEATLDMEQLKQAMQDTRDALASVQDFRVNAVEHMGNDIKELNVVLSENQEVINDMDKGEQYQDAFTQLGAE